MKKNKLWIILCVVTFVIGFLVAKMVSVPYLSMQKEINPLHALSIITTLFIAILVSIVYDREKEKQKNVKQLIINRICNAFELSDNLYLKLIEQIEIITVSSSLKRINMIIECVHKLCERGDVQIKFEKSLFLEKVKSIRDLMTSTPVIGDDIVTAVPQISVEKNSVKYSKGRIAEIEVQIDQLKNLFLELQITVFEK
jgi:hypothetical protein